MDYRGCVEIDFNLYTKHEWVSRVRLSMDNNKPTPGALLGLIPLNCDMRVALTAGGGRGREEAVDEQQHSSN